MVYFRKLLLLIFLSALLIGCTTINVAPQVAVINPDCRWGIATFVNNTETPQAGKRAMSIAANLLRSRGIVDLSVYQPYADCSLLNVCPNATTQIKNVLAWARRNKIRYVMMGSVNEWQYKVGLDGEPVAAVDLELYDSFSGIVVWSAVGSKIGSSRSGLGNTAQDLMAHMISDLRI